MLGYVIRSVLIWCRIGLGCLSGQDYVLYWLVFGCFENGSCFMHEFGPTWFQGFQYRDVVVPLTISVVVYRIFYEDLLYGG